MPSPIATITNEFQTEFRRETAALLSRRFLWYTGAVGFFYIIATAVRLAGIGSEMATASGVGAAPVATLIAGVVGGALYWTAFSLLRRGSVPRHRLGDMVFWLIVVAGTVQLVSGVVGAELSAGGRGALVGVSGALAVLFTHAMAAVFLPLHPREAVRPLVPLLALNAIITLAYVGGDWGAAVGALAVSLAIGLPGTLICWWRHARLESGFTLRMLRRGFREMRHELGAAREIHEALFPRPIGAGPVQLRYSYEPMRAIGGDFVHVHQHGGMLSVILLDVTGHGIPAALTINRIHGELDRIFAEDPAASPGEVLRLLNRYMHLTLAGHSIYATGFCARIDPEADALEYASAGHPPAFLCAVDGTIQDLPSTTFVLGAAGGDDFDPAPESAPFMPGDRLIAYTDGAIEAKSPAGTMLGIAGMQRLLAGTRGVIDSDWSERLLRSIHAHRSGPPGDDTLIVQVSRPIAGVRQAGARRDRAFAAVA